MEAKSKKIIIISIIGTLAAATIFLIVRNLSKRKSLEKKLATGSADILAEIPAASQEEAEMAWPLKIGSGGTDKENRAVKVIQRALNGILTKSYVFKYLTPLTEDGQFGPATENVLYTISKVKEVDYDLWLKMYNYLAANASPVQEQDIFTNPVYSTEGVKITFGDILKSAIFGY